jgi:predicted aspartyl protease
MHLTLRDNLIFVTVTVGIQGRQTEIPDVVVDTGSASTLLSADYLSAIGVMPEPDDVLYTVRGVGGAEVVFARSVERLQVGPQAVRDFEIEIGGLDYGFSLNGILGMDFLLQTGAVIDLKTLALDF